MRTPAQRGPIGNWLRDERLARGWSSAGTARGNLERAGIKVAASVYAEWESGTRIPSEAQLARLQDFYGSKPGQTAPADQSLAAAINDLVAELRAAREERESVDARLRAVEAELRSLRERPADGASPERPVPHGSMG